MTNASLASLLAERYGAHVSDEKTCGDRAAEVLRTLLGHRSVRDCSRVPVGEETIGLLIAAAQSAASSSNLQL
jgi:hypothetical protein